MSTELKSRMPNPVDFVPDVITIAQALNKTIQDGPVPRITIGLMHLRAGQLLGSTYFTIGQTGILRAAGETEERITAVATWQDSPHFTEAERAALELLEAVLTPNPAGERVSDEVYARAAAQYDDKALWSLVMAISYINYFAPAALVAKPIPGKAPGQNYTP
ncbi:carboxymuconolactone decarboxylase family protein [Amycolatopsis pittospori]|uniref:carboxymuconolactone decarboxylase family protein n=1 Tax=Amycolatopsis pittospori TaxID=2749434 RepID=UPI0015F0F9B8|nr:carboxymuconolactone decarboxylase family protein [Amycolatopsis pittospori]